MCTRTGTNKSAGEKRKSMDTTDITITQVTKKSKKASAFTTIPNITSTEKSKELKPTDITILKEALMTFLNQDQTPHYHL